MIMLFKTFISSYFAGLLALDNVQVGQLLLARPAFAGPLLGWLNGCPVEGAKMGLLIELLYIDFIPVGGVVPPNGLVAAAVAVISYAWGGAGEALVFFWGIMSGLLFAKVDYRLRWVRSAWNKRLEAEAEKGVLKLHKWVAGSLMIEAIVTATFIFVFAAIITYLACPLGFESLYDAFDFAYSLMPWLGLTGLYFRFRTQFYKAH